MTDIILLQPKCGVWDIMGVRAPTGLLAIGAVPVHKGLKVVLIDQRINFQWEEEVKKQISAGARIICLTTMVGEQILYMMNASKYVKSLNPNVLTILGGSWAQIQPEMCMQDKNIDVICYGEGDYVLSELMEYSQGTKKLEQIKGIVYRNKQGEIKKTPLSPFIKDLDQLPPIPYDLINLKNYAAVGFRPDKPSMALITSRGCKFRCTFCNIVTLSKSVTETGEPITNQWRGYSVKRLMADLEHLEKKYGIIDFYFNDDLISGSHNRFVEFVKALAESGKDYNWGTAGIRGDHILRLDDETMENLVKSGCKNLDVGVESGNPRMLKLMKKDTTIEVIRKVNQKMSKFPIIIKYTFMGGFPTETEEEFMDTVKFRKILQEENEYAVAPIFFYTPYPGTEMFQVAIDNGFQPPVNLEEWANFNYNTWYHKYPCWLTKSKIRLVENAVFLSYFSDKKMEYKYTNPLLRTLFKMYHPLAKFRYDHGYYQFMAEKKLAILLSKINNHIDLFNRAQKKSSSA